MDSTGVAPREIAVPVSAFAALRAELTKEAGALPTIHALHRAGYDAGVHAARQFGDPEDVRRMSARRFWSAVSEYFQRRGWGSLTLDGTHGAVAVLQAGAWAEAAAQEKDPEASCFFSTGFISGLLSTLVGAPIAVLEITCLARGDDGCRFAFGSEEAIHELYGRLLDGVELQEALDAA